MSAFTAYSLRWAEIARAFLLLGVTAFGGPVAHLGYFREAFVVRRGWLDDRDFADLIALCQFLPGPASSQVGFALGWRRGGLVGALIAWSAFTLPSAIALVAAAAGATHLDGEWGQALVQGLKLVAVAVVAHAVWQMAGRLCPDRLRVGIALAAVFASVTLGGTLGQLGAIGLGAAVGLCGCRPAPADTERHGIGLSTRVSAPALALFLALLLALPFAAAWAGGLVAVADAFYRAGALVFGGGHVVLPLLQSEVVAPGWVSEPTFITGYGLAQAVPGPLFTFAAYLGASMAPGGAGWATAALATVMIFLPGMLLLIGVLPHWERLRASSRAQRLIQGTNAAVVGILGAALFDPIWRSGVVAPIDFALALTGFLLLSVWRWPAWGVVILLVVARVAVAWV